MNTKFVFGILALSAALLFGAVEQAGAAQEMIMTSEVATSHWKTKYMDDLAKEIEKRTQGRIKPKTFHAGQLYKDRDAMAALGTGAVHMVWPTTGRLESLDPRAGVLSLPFLITDEMMRRPGVADKLAKILSSYVEGRGVKVLGLLRTADVFFLTKDKPIKSPADLNGMKIRITGGKVVQDMIRALGASPVSMAASEMATAIAQGAIDSIVTSPGGWKMVGSQAKFGSYVPGLSLLMYAILIDKKWLEKLEARDRTAILGAVSDVAANQWAEATENDRLKIKKITSEGGTFSAVSDSAYAKFKEMSRPASEGFIKKYPEAYKGFLKAVQ